MPIYFKPLRRKIGVVTLVVACVFMVGWTRSFRSCEMLAFPNREPHDSYAFGLSSASRIGLMTAAAQTSPSQPIVLGWEFHAERLSDELWNGLPKTLEMVPSFDQIGFLYGEKTYADLNTNFTIRLYLIPYWSIVIPLTLLSAWLLLNKPREKRAAPKAAP